MSTRLDPMDAGTEVSGTAGSVTAYLADDHDRLEAALREVSAAVEAGDMAQARARFHGYAEGLERHARIEEDLLFPLFEARTGVNSGPTVVLRSEHDELRRALGLLRGALEAEDASAFRDALRFLNATLPEHNALEEHILYPTIDRFLSPRERQSLVERLHRE